MPERIRTVIAAIAFNAVLAGLMQAAAPAQPRLSDRAEYDYNSTQPLSAGCPHTIYCYRVLVPILLAQIPMEPEARWRGLQWLAHTVTGATVAIAVTPFASPWLTTVLLQTSYAFAFTAYDPFTPDPVVFIIAALMLYCWMTDRALLATVLAVVFVFAKETVALLALAPAIAAFVFPGRAARTRWLWPAALSWTALLLFHWYMDTYAGWGIARNPAASFSTGSWLALWWKNNPSLIRKALIIFSPFGFAWLYAWLGMRHAPQSVRHLAIGAVLPMLALAFVQTPERALGNGFFVIVPLAAVFLSRVPAAAGWAAAATNGLVTARIGLSTEWLPSTTILLIPASVCAVWAVASSRRAVRISS